MTVVECLVNRKKNISKKNKAISGNSVCVTSIYALLGVMIWQL